MLLFLYTTTPAWQTETKGSFAKTVISILTCFPDLCLGYVLGCFNMILHIFQCFTSVFLDCAVKGI